jgi:hypothetical protein
VQVPRRDDAAARQRSLGPLVESRDGVRGQP